MPRKQREQDDLRDTVELLSKQVSQLADLVKLQMEKLEQQHDRLTQTEVKLKQAEELAGYKIGRVLEELSKPSVSAVRLSTMPKKPLTLEELRKYVSAADAFLWLEEHGWSTKYLE